MIHATIWMHLKSIMVKKTDTEDLISYDSIYMKNIRNQTIVIENRWLVASGQKWKKGFLSHKGIYVIEMFNIMIMVVVTLLNIFFKTMHLKLVNFIIC